MVFMNNTLNITEGLVTWGRLDGRACAFFLTHISSWCHDPGMNMGPQLPEERRRQGLVMGFRRP